MDNDIKIEKKTGGKHHKEVLLFLDKELKSLNRGTSTSAYDIKKEYAKTKKNKSWFSWLVLFASLVAISLACFVTLRVISIQTSKIKVNLEQFDDLNLRTLLDTVSKTQMDYDAAVRDKLALESEMTQRITEIEQKRDNDLFVLDTLKLVKAEYNKRAQRIRSEATANISSVKAEYAAQIAELDAKIVVCQNQLSEYDSAKVRQAEEQEKVLNSERQLRQVQQQELRARYELQITNLKKSMDQLRAETNEEIRNSVTQVQNQYEKKMDALDPVIEDERSLGIIEKERGVFSSPYIGARIISINDVQDEKLIESYNKYQSYYDDYQYLNSKISSMPQHNSIPNLVKANYTLVGQMTAAYEEATLSLYKDKKSLQKELDKKNALEQEIFNNLLSSAKANACIYSAYGSGDIQVYITKRARYLINEVEGAAAEFDDGNSVVKGRVILCEDGVYRFTGNPDSGSEIDISNVTPGTIVRILG